MKPVLVALLLCCACSDDKTRPLQADASPSDASAVDLRFDLWVQDSDLRAEMAVYGSGLPLVDATRGVLRSTSSPP